MSDECIEFKEGWTNQDGYGVVWRNGKSVGAHRVAYCDHHGIPLEAIKGMVIRHTCDNRPCINPRHLVPGTQKDNIQDMIDRNRLVNLKGEDHGMAKLTEDDVRHIRSEYVRGSKTAGYSALAKKYGVTFAMIRFIVKRVSWKHVI